MAPSLEPMTVGGILDRTFFLYRNNIVRFLAIVAIVQVPLALLQLVMQKAILDGGSAMAMSLSVAFIAMFANQLSQGALVKSVSESYLGNSVTVGDAYGFVLPKILTLVVAALLVALAIIGGMILLIIPGIIFALWFSLTTQIVVVEGVKATKAMGRSKDLVKGCLGKVFAVAIVTFLITGVINFGCQKLGAMLVEQFEVETTMGALTIIQLVILVGAVLTAPISASAFILLYYDMRIRKEGFDLEMLAQSFGPGAAATDASMSQ